MHLASIANIFLIIFDKSALKFYAKFQNGIFLMFLHVTSLSEIFSLI